VRMSDLLVVAPGLCLYASRRSLWRTPGGPP
jgi:hypothetical protein